MTIRGLLWGLAGLTLVACKTSVSSGEFETDGEQVEACMDGVCFKVLACDPLIDPEPGFEQTCRDYCEGLVTEAEAAQCSEALTELIACSEASECEDYLAWIDNEPGAVFSEQEAALRDGCGVDVRAAE